MNIEKLTSQFQQDLGAAQSIAISNNHSAIEGIHVLSAMLSDDGSSVSNALKAINVDTTTLVNKTELEINKLAVVNNPNSDIGISQNLLRLLTAAEKIATDKGDSYLSTELFLLAIIQGNDTTTQLLKDAGVTEQALTQA
ncbi:MAG: type VI secretion system ATPase TssH, partial [Proteobacteria bacterium]|nr:type VI secretion system ATPase TssH [Pseudomonadota bacterium]